MQNDFTLVIPCYNEEESVSLLKEHMDCFLELMKGRSLELLFVDDGSKDKTVECLISAMGNYPSFRLLRHEVNQNLGAAVRTGINAARGNYIAVIDADCSYSLQIIPSMLAELEKGHDCVSASAHHPDAGFAAHTPAYRVFLSKTVVKMYNILFWKKYYSYTSIFRVYRREAIHGVEIKSNGFVAMAEIMAKLILQDKKILDFPARSSFRTFGVSKARIFNIIKDHLHLMGRIILYKYFKIRSAL